MYKIGICDDEAATCTELKRMIMNIGKKKSIDISPETWKSGNELLSYLKERGNAIHLLFLDVELPDIDGIDIGKIIREKNKDYNMLIAYISSKKEYSIMLHQNQPCAFLIKPIREKDVAAIIDKGYRRLAEEKYTFQYKKGHDYFYMNCSDIIYFESKRKVVHIVKSNNEREEYYGKLAEVSQQLPDCFSIIHKSYIINKNYVKQYKYEEVIMVNDDKLPISGPYRNTLRKQIQMNNKRES